MSTIFATAGAIGGCRDGCCLRGEVVATTGAEPVGAARGVMHELDMDACR